jgi:DNA-binding PucR family transcriptional regulator
VSTGRDSGRPELETMFGGLARSGELRPFRELVGRVEAYDRKHSSDLIRTLKVFFAANGNASEAADRLYLHRNSLPYRLERIQELTGLDLKDHRARLALQLGLLATEKEEDGDETQHP